MVSDSAEVFAECRSGVRTRVLGFTWILDAGFQIRAMREPRPTEEVLANRPDLEDATRVPYYIVFDLVCAGQAGVT